MKSTTRTRKTTEADQRPLGDLLAPAGADLVLGDVALGSTPVGCRDDRVDDLGRSRRR